MSLISASIVPHPPILIPGVGKENSEKLIATSEAFKQIEYNLYQSKVDTIIVISPHGDVQMDNFTINLSKRFLINLEEFGDYTTKKELKGDTALGYTIKDVSSLPVDLIHNEIMDHGSSVPLLMLTQNLANTKILPIYYSGLDYEAHFEFGKIIRDVILTGNKRIAVIASGDLSHKLSKNSPAGYSSKGAKFDQKLIELLRSKKNQDIINMNPGLIEKAHECGLKSIIVLLGILNESNYSPKLLSYEYPFGVGYMVMDMAL